MVGAGQAVRAGWDSRESHEMGACDGGQWEQMLHDFGLLRWLLVA
jgi:hypothetical protein